MSRLSPDPLLPPNLEAELFADLFPEELGLADGALLEIIEGAEQTGEDPLLSVSCALCWVQSAFQSGFAVGRPENVICPTCVPPNRRSSVIPGGHL